MSRIAAVLIAAGLASVVLSAQGAQQPGALYGADPSYTVPRTPDGHPDLQGVWAHNSVTPMTRPRQWKDKPLMTDAELAELKSLVGRMVDQGADAIFQNIVEMALNAKETGAFKQVSYDATTGNYNQFWMVERDWDHRTSLIIDPPDGQFPPLTA
jgi:hypothetical protein